MGFVSFLTFKNLNTLTWNRCHFEPLDVLEKTILPENFG